MEQRLGSRAQARRMQGRAATGSSRRLRPRGGAPIAAMRVAHTIGSDGDSSQETVRHTSTQGGERATSAEWRDEPSPMHAGKERPGAAQECVHKAADLKCAETARESPASQRAAVAKGWRLPVLHDREAESVRVTVGGDAHEPLP
eukprot:scaffold2823_cov118-Isochrysis_galbana.AAC.5